MIPAISFACKNTNLNIMDRTPRYAKLDHYLNGKLISFLNSKSILYKLSIDTYFYCLNDFGIRPFTVWFIALLKELVLHP